MSVNVLLNKSAIYRENNFILVGRFKKNDIRMGIDKLSFVSDIELNLECSSIYEKLDFLLKEKDDDYYVKKSKDKNYRKCIKVTSKEVPEFYLLISYDFLRRNDKQSIRFELSPQYGMVDSIDKVIKWLKDGIGEQLVNYLLKKARITRIDITADIYADKFIADYYFSIPDAKKGGKFVNHDDCKNNYFVGSRRSERYLLVYEKMKLSSLAKTIHQNELFCIKEKHIQKRITRLEFRIKPKTPVLLSTISSLENPFLNIRVYSDKKVNRRFNDFLPYLRNEKSVPSALKTYQEEKCLTRYEKSKIKETLESCRSKYVLDIDWKKWQDISRILSSLV